jgi:hypothetical protein
MSPDHPDKTSLIHEIGSGPGYFVHAGENEGHAVIVKVFNAGPNVIQYSMSTSAYPVIPIPPISQILVWAARSGVGYANFGATLIALGVHRSVFIKSVTGCDVLILECLNRFLGILT